MKHDRSAARKLSPTFEKDLERQCSRFVQATTKLSSLFPPRRVDSFSCELFTTADLTNTNTSSALNDQATSCSLPPVRSFRYYERAMNYWRLQAANGKQYSTDGVFYRRTSNRELRAGECGEACIKSRPHQPGPRRAKENENDK